MVPRLDARWSISAYEGRRLGQQLSGAVPLLECIAWLRYKALFVLQLSIQTLSISAFSIICFTLCPFMHATSLHPSTRRLYLPPQKRTSHHPESWDLQSTDGGHSGKAPLWHGVLWDDDLAGEEFRSRRGEGLISRLIHPISTKAVDLALTTNHHLSGKCPYRNVAGISTLDYSPETVSRL